MKICSHCKEKKDISEFNKHSGRKDGFQTMCRECNRKRSRQYYSENKSHHIKNIKRRQKIYLKDNKDKMLALLLSSSCKDCGNSDHRVLEFDHLPQFKKDGNVSELLLKGSSWMALKKEMDKCEIVCANCHKIRTIERAVKNYRKLPS